MLRLSHRTYTPQLARMEKNRQAAIIPEKYIYVDDCCFKGNGKIKEVWLSAGCRIIGSEAFAGCQFRKEVVFPERLEEIPESCFERCGKLEKVVLPERVERIQKRAFYRCRELKEIAFPDTLEEIGEEAFYFCNMETLKLPQGLKKLDDRAFFGCKKIREITVPESVQFLGNEVFHGCNRLEILEIRHDPEEIGNGIANGGCIIRCRKGGKVDAYCEAEGLKREYID